MSLTRFLQRAILVLAFFLVVTTFAQPTENLLQKRDDDDEDIPTFQPSAPPAAKAGGMLYFLSQSKGAILSMSPTGGTPRTILSGLMTKGPDGITVDKAAGHIYFSNMRPGSIERVNIDGTGRKTIVDTGVFQVGKQIVLVLEDGVKKLYWCAREGQKVMRANVDGSSVEVVIDTSKDKCTGRECKNAVGVAVDTKNGWVYWTQKGAGGTGSIHRAPTKLQAGQTAASRSDIQVVLDKLPEPIDLRWVDGYGLYWTDRGHAEGGNSVSRMQMGADVQAGKAQFAVKPRPLVEGLNEGIGIAVDPVGQKMWFTELGGRIFQSNLDGTSKSVIATGQGILTGIDYVP
ncbi:YWTD domain-containing protein [Microthyrium microscopicum]|uniref:YWTD domain-containing protein n=1 Tax=Microthyrium microscopicum TaxID=703497 RepID=A0A6A6U5G7_9PEZI|nr:YWTD domain-containing protein [Microthyrium microscopicum]